MGRDQCRQALDVAREFFSLEGRQSRGDGARDVGKRKAQGLAAHVDTDQARARRQGAPEQLHVLGPPSSMPILVLGNHARRLAKECGFLSASYRARRRRANRHAHLSGRAAGWPGGWPPGWSEPVGWPEAQKKSGTKREPRPF